MHCPRLHHFCLWGFLVTSGTHSRLFIHEFGKSCHEHMQITTMNCNWTINHVKKYPFLFEDFILYNFSVIFFLVISQFQFKPTLTAHSPTDHISYPFMIFFSSPYRVCMVLGLYCCGSWYQEKMELWQQGTADKLLLGKAKVGICLTFTTNTF